jgi:8-oxo-dGTP pyrophosphatase MutT (NUDIX family)
MTSTKMENYKHTLSVTAVVENSGRFLFIKRPGNLGNFPDKWVFPGGKVEHGEDVIQALIRELKEETGLDFSTEIAFLSAYQFSRSEDNSSSQGLVFLVRALNTDLKVDTESIAHHRWIEPSEIINYREETIYGMEVHVRNALIALRKNMLLDWRFYSVTNYQATQSSMTKDYLNEIMTTSNLDTFLKF